MAADNISVPISIEWTYEGKKWANSPHGSNVVIEPQDSAPMPSVSSFDYPGDYIIYFNKPNFKKPGKYLYLVYQTNQDFEEAGMSVSYDKTIYRIIFFVQQGSNGLITSVYAYDDSRYNSDDENYNKQARITFVNDDPHIHKNNGDIVNPNDPYHPFHPENPWYPDGPTDPTNPYFPVEPNRPTDPTNPDRNENNTPIYPTEPSNPDRPNEPINPSKPPIEGRDPDYWPEREEPNPIPDRPFPWWPWPWVPEDDEFIDQNSPAIYEKPWWWDMLFPEEEFVPNRPAIDPSDPTNPLKPVNPARPEVPWWWNTLYPDIVFDPSNPNKPVEDAPSVKPWWWDKLFPNIDYNPKNLAKVTTDPPRDDNQDLGAKSDEDRFKDNSNRFFPYGSGNNDSPNSSIVEGNRRDKNSKTNVKTGIRSISLWLLILVIASILYILTRNKNKKESY